MFKYCQIADEKTGLVYIGEGTNIEYYQSIGMVELDVEKSDVDGNWYLKDKCPHKTEEEKAAERQAEFESKFFNIPGYGWFRRVPKGYNSAVDCLNLAFNNINILGGLPEGLLIFYTQPDFTKPEECTEEWLVAHQIIMPAMTVQEFGQLYASFSAAWNTQEHVNEV